MKIVLTIFAPILIAIILRIVLTVAALILVPLSQIISRTFSQEVENVLLEFNMFSWDESWLYWVLVILGSFLAEMAIWQNDND